jgi:hypothetical protein
MQRFTSRTADESKKRLRLLAAFRVQIVREIALTVCVEESAVEPVVQLDALSSPHFPDPFRGVGHICPCCRALGREAVERFLVVGRLVVRLPANSHPGQTLPLSPLCGQSPPSGIRRFFSG